MVSMAKKKDISAWAFVLAGAFTGVLIISFDIASIAGAVVGWLCGWQCHKWAARVRGNNNAAFLVGFFFGLIGLLIMWLVYRKRLKKAKK